MTTPPSDLFISVTGMDCAACATRVENCLKYIPGITNYNVSLFSNNARLQYDYTIISSESIIQQVRQLGFGCEQLASNINSTLSIEIVLPSYEERRNKYSHFSFSFTSNYVLQIIKALETYLLTISGIKKVTTNIEYNWLNQPKHYYMDITYDPIIIGARTILSQKITYETLCTLITSSSAAASSRSNKTQEQLPLLLSSANKSSTTSTSSLTSSNILFLLRQELPDTDANIVKLMWKRLYIGTLCTIIASILAYILSEDYVNNHINNTILINLNKELIPLLTIRTLIQWILSTITLLYLGIPLILQAYKAARYSYMMTMDTLVSASSLAAYFYSLGMIIAAVCGVSRKELSTPIYETTTILLTLVALGRTIEHSAKKQTVKILKQLASSSNTIADIIDIPNTDNLNQEKLTSSNSCCTSTSATSGCTNTLSIDTLSTYSVQTISSKLLHLQDIIRISPGMVVPADSIIIAGQTSIDESTLTGESIPVMKQIHDTIIGGSTNIEGVIYARVIALPGTGALSHIVQLIEEAQSIRPPLQLIADKIASIFTPLIFILSILSFFIWYYLAISNKINTNDVPPGTFALLFSLALLVVSCPCATSLAVPTATMVATLVSTKFGVLIKNGSTLETLTKVQHIIFDKTGTLTEGKPIIDTIKLLVPDRLMVAAAKHAGFTIDIINNSSSLSNNNKVSASLAKTINVAQAAALVLAAEAEEGSHHPLATAILEAIKFDKIRIKRKQIPVEPNNKVNTKTSSCGSSNTNTTVNDTTNSSLSRISIPGCGIIAEMNNCTIHIGKLDWLLSSKSDTTSNNIDIDTSDIDDDILSDTIKDMNTKGLSILGLAIDNKLYALLGAKDNLRSEIKSVLQWLMLKNIHIWIASGDNEGSVNSIANELHIPLDHTYSTLTPEGKANLVTRIQLNTINNTIDENINTKGLTNNEKSKSMKRNIVMMIGDGINDAVALSTADIGMAMNNTKSASTNATSNNTTLAASVTTSIIAQDAAHIIVQANTLEILPTLLRLANTTHYRIQINFLWAFLYNLLAMPLAGGLLYPFSISITIPPSFAGISELFSSVPVILGSLLIYTFNYSSAVWKKEIGVSTTIMNSNNENDIEITKKQQEQSIIHRLSKKLFNPLSQ